MISVASFPFTSKRPLNFRIENEDEISNLKDQTGFSYSIADVTDQNFIETIDKDLDGLEISGIAYCVDTFLR